MITTIANQKKKKKFNQSKLYQTPKNHCKSNQLPLILAIEDQKKKTHWKPNRSQVDAYQPQPPTSAMANPQKEIPIGNPTNLNAKNHHPQPSKPKNHNPHHHHHCMPPKTKLKTHQTMPPHQITNSERVGQSSRWWWQ